MPEITAASIARQERRKAREMKAHIEQLRLRWPQAHTEEGNRGSNFMRLIHLPGFLLPPGWTHNICTVSFLTAADGAYDSLMGFWVDIHDLGIIAKNRDGSEYRKSPTHSWDCAFGYDGSMLPKPYWMGGIWDGIPGFSQWRDVRFFCWRQQERSIKQTLYTKAMIIRQRFQRVV